jgi:hypothetical protein
MHLQSGLRCQPHVGSGLERDLLFEQIPAEDAWRRRGEDDVEGIPSRAFGKAAANPERRLGVGMSQDGAAGSNREHELETCMTPDFGRAAPVDRPTHRSKNSSR